MAEIDRLVLVWDANFAKMEDKLNKVIRSNYSAATKIQDTWRKTNVGEGLGKQLDGLAARGPAAALGLNKLGVAGLGVGAALGAMVVALNGAKAAMAFADDIADTADRLHLTTDALQEYREALRLAGGEEKDADGALEAFSVTLGNAQAGLPKAIKNFRQLGFSKAEIQSFTDTDTALRAVIERIGEIENTAQRDAIIERLGLGKIKQLIEGGVTALDQLRAKAREAGLVMDAELIKRAADGQEEFETLSKVIDIQLKSALVDLAPVLVGLLGLFADIAKLTGDIVDGFRSIDNKSTRTLQNRLAQLQQERATAAAGGGTVQGRVLERLGVNTQEDRLNRIDNEMRQVQGQLAQRAWDQAQVRPGFGGGAGRTLTDLSGGRGPKGTKADPIVTVSLPDDVAEFDPSGKRLGSREDLELQAWLERRFPQDKPGKEVDGFDAPGLTPFKSTDWITDAVEDAVDAAARVEEAYRDAVHDGIGDGLRAIADGNAAEFFANRLREAMFNAATDALTNAFFNAQSSGGGGGGGWLGAALNIAGDFLGFGSNARGTDNWRGGLSKVGEFGPEIVNLPRGAQVIPNDVLRGLSARPQGGGLQQVVNQYFTLDARGGIGFEEFRQQTDQRIQTISAVHAQKAAETALRGVPARVTQFNRTGV